MIIIPTILANNQKSFLTMLHRLLPLCSKIHLDVMDGKFVKTTSPLPDDWPDFREYKNHLFEAHLMVEDPIRYIPIAIEKGVKKIIVHAETITDKECAWMKEYCKKKKCTFFVAFSPSTHVTRVSRIKKHVDGIMLMGVYPGYNKSVFVSHTIERLKEVRKKHPKLFIQIDGGANRSTVKLASQYGAHAYASGSFISLSDHPNDALTVLKYEAKKSS